MEKDAAQDFIRLPTTVVPLNYRITLIPNLTQLIFDGYQQIEIEVKEPTNEIYLNVLDIKVADGITWTSNDGDGSITQIASGIDINNEVMRISFNTPIPIGKGKLSMEFCGILNDKLRGFYRSSYKESNGEERYNAVTHFEPTGARSAFPCWDEPGIKATFDITLVAPKNRIALSNMPEKSLKPYDKDPNLLVHEFDTTPIMSTYLVAFVVGEFDYVEEIAPDGVQHRVYTPVGKKEQGSFSLDLSVKAFAYFKEYFGIPYNLPKVDLIAISDFPIGAMENWGLITFRESRLLVDEKETAANYRQIVALVVAHELSHMWFGNLVTPFWWNDLWLKEGYASFIMYLCVDHVFPEWDIWTEFVVSSQSTALELDGLISSHPIEVPVNHPREIEEIFDTISYNKGSSIIRMLYHYIGDTDFKKGMNLYLTRHQFGNTYTEDLWKALAEASSKPVTKVMRTWTQQMGYPLISVNEVARDGNNVRMTLSQEKFNSDPNKEVGTQSWMVPLTFSSSAKPSNVIHEALMTEKQIVVTINNVEPDQWVKVNAGSTGFYRVRYSSNVLEEFLPSLRNKSMPLLDRLELVDNSFALVQAGKASTIDIFKLLEACVDDDSYPLWSNISFILEKLNLLLDHTDFHDAFKAYGRSIFESIGNVVGWEKKSGESDLQALLRGVVLNRLGLLGHKKTVDEANSRFERHVSDKKSLDPNLRTAVYKAVVSNGDENTFNRFMQLYENAEQQEEKSRIGAALGCTKDLKLMQKVFDFAVSSSVRKQDSVFVIIPVAKNGKAGAELAWNFFKKNWELFRDGYPAMMVQKLVKCITENFVTGDEAREVEAFFHEHSIPGTERAVQQSLESIRINEAWLKRDLNSCNQFLKAYNTEGTV